MQRPTPLGGRASGVLAAALALPLPSTAATVEQGPALELAVAYTGDAWNNSRGGLRRGSAYLDNLDVTLTVDGDRLWSIDGLVLHAHGLYNNGSTFSGRYIGDAFVASNIDTGGAVRLYEAWLDWSPGAASPHSLRMGLYDINSEFDVGETRGLFINSVHGIGQDFAQSGENGPSIFPSTGLALRWHWQVRGGLDLRVAAVDGVPGDPDRPDRTSVRLSDDEGALLAAEVTAALGDSAIATLGHWRYTADFALLAPPAAAGPARADGNRGTYIGLEGRLADLPGLGRVDGFLRAGLAEDRFNPFDRFYSGGVTLDGPWPGRDDRLGLAVAAARTGGPWRAARAGEGLGTERHEYNVELTWRVPVGDYLVLQPDLQWIVNPGAEPGLRDSLAVGLRFELASAWAWPGS